MVMPQEVFERIELDITLIDVNDNSPHFLQSSVQVDIAEGQTTRVEVPGLVAEDKDASSKLSYQIDEKDLFQLEVTDGRAFLVLKAALGLLTKTKSHPIINYKKSEINHKKKSFNFFAFNKF